MKSDNFAKILKHAGVSVTKPRQAIFATLLHAEKPLKNGEVAALTPSVDRASVYRTLELFATLGITQTTIRGWTPLVELAEPFKPHHHHITCEHCGRVIEIENSTLEDVLGLVATRHNFTLTEHLVELTGTCSDCRKKAASS